MHVFHVATNLNRAELLEPRCASLEHWQGIEKEHGAAQSIWPEGQVDCRRPAGACVQKLLARTLQQVANRALCDSILKMGVHAAKSELLLRVLACLFEGVVRKSPIIAMIVQNFNAVVSGKMLEGALGLDCFGRT